MSKIAEKVMQYKYSLAVWTDRADCIIDKSAPLNEEKLLEIRCFDESGEFRAYRSTADRDFNEREIISEYASPEKEKQIEIRGFDKSGEDKPHRIEIKDTKDIKDITDETINNGDIFYICFDEYHYLDIDMKRSSGNVKYTTGGGMYHLPDDVKDKKRLKVRNYYNFDKNGIARPVDWRLVGFCDKEE